MNIKFKHVKLLCIAFALGAFLFSCTKEVTNNYMQDAPPVGTTVTNNVTAIMSFSDAESTLKKGDKLKLRVNRTGNKIEEYTIDFEGTYDFNGERLILCKTPEGLAVGQGDSGSPVLTADGKVVGILCYGYYFNNNQFCARAIEDVLEVGNTEKSANTASNTSNSKFMPLGTVNLAFGMNQEGLERYARNDKQGYLANFTQASGYEKPVNNNHKSASSNDIIAGNSICVNLVSGDRVNFVATGTASYISDNKIYGFGHAFLGSKPVAIPAFVADMKTMIESGDVAFKMSVPTETSIGGMIADEMEGILIDKNVEPAAFSVSTKITIGTDEANNDLHKIASFTNIDEEIYHAMNLPPYLVFDYLREESYNWVNAKGLIRIEFESGTYTKNFNVYDDAFWVDFSIYDAIFWEFNPDNYEGNIQSVTFEATITESEM